MLTKQSRFEFWGFRGNFPRLSVVVVVPKLPDVVVPKLPVYADDDTLAFDETANMPRNRAVERTSKA